MQGFKLHNVAEQQSCASFPQQWHVSRGLKINPVNQLVVARPMEFGKRKPVTCQIDLR